MATQRRDFAGTGKTWCNGTLFSEAAQTSVKIGGALNRMVTQGYTGEVQEDPTRCEISIEGAVLRRSSLVSRLRRWKASGEDITVKVQIGTETVTARGKIGALSVRTENGKSSFSAEFMGDQS